MKKEFNPNWPFPQYDEDGKRLLPLGWHLTKAQEHERLANEVGEALL